MSTVQALISQAEDALIKLDPKLGELIKQQRPIYYKPRTDYFASLCRSIVGQQVSVAAANAIFSRLLEKTGLKPASVMRLNDKDIKTIGLSRQKAAYIHDLARHFNNNPGVYNHLDKQSDEEVIAELTAIKGIGRWTAQMFLMFTMARLDIFAPDDIGLQNAMKKLHAWDKVPPKRELETTAEQWRPYRTVASWHLWESLKSTAA